MSDADDGSRITYAWTFTGAQTFVDAATNPAMRSDYDESTTSTPKVSVINAAALITSARLALTTRMFSDALQPAEAELIINERDFDQTGTDDAELMEILDPGSSAVRFDRYRADLVNGSDNMAYTSYTARVDLYGSGFFVILFVPERAFSKNPKRPGLFTLRAYQIPFVQQLENRRHGSL